LPWSFNRLTFGDAAFRISSLARVKLHARIQRDAADRRRDPLATDPDSLVAINFAESIDFSPSQKIRTIRTQSTFMSINHTRDVDSSDTSRA
jgi:hypothetical protein